MLGDVVAAAREVGRVVVVTDDAQCRPGRSRGRSGSRAQGRARPSRPGSPVVDGHALVVNADLPLATPEAIERLAAAGLALVEAADGTTNALSLPDPAVFAPLYGPGSAARFRAHAPFATVAIPELEADVDTDEDLERLASRLGPRTRALLAVRA